MTPLDSAAPARRLGDPQAARVTTRVSPAHRAPPAPRR